MRDKGRQCNKSVRADTNYIDSFLQSEAWLWRPQLEKTEARIARIPGKKRPQERGIRDATYRQS